MVGIRAAEKREKQRLHGAIIACAEPLSCRGIDCENQLGGRPSDTPVNGIQYPSQGSRLYATAFCAKSLAIFFFKRFAHFELDVDFFLLDFFFLFNIFSFSFVQLNSSVP